MLTVAFRAIFKDGSSDLKAKIIQKIVHKIEIGRESIKIHFVVGKNVLEKAFEPLAASYPPRDFKSFGIFK